jgi:hypothetical protein
MYPKNQVIQFPNGKWGFVGKVSPELAFITKEGNKPSEKQIEVAKHCGPGIVGLKSRVWNTQEEATTEAQNLKLKYNI